MKQDKFLLGIISGIIVLVAVALAIFLTRQGVALDYLAEDQPKGVVFNYILALHNGDFEKAYGYLSDGENKPSITRFRQNLLVNQQQWKNSSVDILEDLISTDYAVVIVYSNFSSGGMFSGGYSNGETASLEKTGGEWRIISMPYLYWSYDWYQPVIK